MLGFSGYLLIILISLFICGIYYAEVLLGEVNFHELVYYIFNPGSSTGVDTVAVNAIKPCIWLFTLSFAVLFVLTKFIIKIKAINIIVLICLLVICIIYLLHCLGFFKYVLEVLSKSKIYEEEYVDTNNVKITFPKNKNNLILIYLESMEASLFSSKNGGAFDESRIPELEKLALENISFSNTDKLGGAYTLDKTSFTAGALVASTTGTPINTRAFNIYSEKNKYMENVKALGDVLKENGYNLELIQGSDIKFSKEDMYFKEHGNYKIFDNFTAKERGYIDKNYYEWWGIEDKKLFEYAKTEITNIAKEGRPFAVSLFTMDTHFKDGYIDETFEPKFKEHYSNSYACSSKMVNEFIDWLKQQYFYENSVIILTGDHRTAQNNFYADFKGYKRTIYNAFLNVDKKGKFKNREFSMLDMYPTILSSLGVKIEGDKIGLGVDLFSGKKTLIEKMGEEKFNKEISKSNKYYNDNLG